MRRTQQPHRRPFGLTHSASTSRVVLGSRLTFNLTVTNNGPAPAAHVVLTDRLPEGVVFISASSDQAACTRIGSDVFCDFAALAPGAGGTARGAGVGTAARCAKAGETATTGVTA